MPSPLGVGIDPYLEPRFWRNFHETFIPYARGALMPQLPDRYWATVEERVTVEAIIVPPEKVKKIYPDVFVVEQIAGLTSGTATAIATIPAAVTTEPEIDEFVIVQMMEVPETVLHIVDLSGNRVVTVIELLNPTNKVSPGREVYREKQQAILQSETNLVEIDLLKGGEHTVALPFDVAQGLRPYYGLVTVWRYARKHFEVYPFPLGKRLPRIAIPLLPEDKDVMLDIQAVFDRCYDDAAFVRVIDYTQPPPVPLTEEERQWVAERLTAAQEKSAGQ